MAISACTMARPTARGPHKAPTASSSPAGVPTHHSILRAWYFLASSHALQLLTAGINMYMRCLCSHGPIARKPPSFCRGPLAHLAVTKQEAMTPSCHGCWAAYLTRARGNRALLQRSWACPGDSLNRAGCAHLLWRDRKGSFLARRRSSSMTTPSRRLPTTLRGMNVYSDSPSRADAGSLRVATCVRTRDS